MDSEQHYLTPLLEPKAIAIIGASEREGSIGAMLVRNMLDADYRGELFFVNPNHSGIFGHRCHASVDAIPQRLDVAVICTRAQHVPDIVEACGRAGTRSAIVISGGFAESDPAGVSLQRQALETARRYRMRLLGPNCLGILRPSAGINLAFTHGSADPGGIGLVSQSGALTNAILDWARPNKVGFSSVVSLGNPGDVDFGEILDFLVTDSKTKSIFLYIEGIRNARRFMSALRAAARCKPVLLIKVGRHPAGEQAALSHCGALTGDDAVFDAALRRAGVVRLTTVSQMYSTAQALMARFRPRGNRLVIITNGGGPGAMAADQAADLGLPLAALTPATLARLDEILPAGWSKNRTNPNANPLDIGDDTTPTRFANVLEACQADDNVDGILAILTPQVLSDPTQTARTMIELAHRSDKPLVTCWMGEDQVAEARLLFKGAGIPSLRTPEAATELFSHLSNYFRNQKLLMQTPAALSDHQQPQLESARLVIETALQAGRRVMSEMESKALLAAFHVPIAQTMMARSTAEAMVLAGEIGLPVAMKIDALGITDKSDCGGVRLDIASLAAVHAAYLEILEEVRKRVPDAVINGVAIEPMIVKPHGRELRIGVRQDRIFGPVIHFGPGGKVNERIDDPAPGERAVALPPLNSFLVTDLLQSTRTATRLGAFRNMPPADLAAVEAVLLRVSEMVCELPWLRELDINPLIVDENGAVAVDARIVIDHLPPNAGRYDHMAIHPYPAHLVTQYQASARPPVTIRPIKPEDAPLEQDFIQGLSAESRYLRFMNTIHELPPAQLARLTQIDYDREMAFIATIEEAGCSVEVGVARYAINPDGESCEFAIVVADAWHGTGLARRLMSVLIDAAKNHGGLKSMNGEFLSGNQHMIRFVTRLGFVLSPHPEDAGLKLGVLSLS